MQIPNMITVEHPILLHKLILLIILDFRFVKIIIVIMKDNPFPWTTK